MPLILSMFIGPGSRKISSHAMAACSKVNLQSCPGDRGGECMGKLGIFGPAELHGTCEMSKVFSYSEKE